MKNKPILLGLIVLLIETISGCHKPDTVTTIKTSDKELSFTVETDVGRGAISSDYTDVYAVVVRGAKADKKQILGGENLKIAKIVLLDPDNATVCLTDGITVHFRNYVTLSVGDGASRTIRTHLQEESGGVCP
jgi:hypothetical protein